MSTPIPFERRMPTQDRIATSSLTTKEMERKIGSVDATQIETIAQAIIARIMMKLNIDIEKIPPAVVDENGIRHQVAYDPASKIMQALLPEIIQQITQAFATPGLFLEEGLSMRFVGSEGLLDKVTAQDCMLKEQICHALQHFVKIRPLNNLSDLTLTLKGPLSPTDSMPEVLFNLGVVVNGELVGHDCCSLQDFERQAHHKHVF